MSAPKPCEGCPGGAGRPLPLEALTSALVDAGDDPWPTADAYVDAVLALAAATPPDFAEGSAIQRNS